MRLHKVRNSKHLGREWPSRWWKHPAALLLVIFIFHAVTNCIVLSLDKAPLNTDEAMHFRASGQLFTAASNLDFACFPFLWDSWYPPLQLFLSMPFFFLFGYSPDIAVLSTLVASGVLIISVYTIGKVLHDTSAGLLAAALTVLMPGIFAFSRTYLQEFTLAATVALSLALLLMTDNFSKKGYTLAFGISVALGLLTRWTWEVFIIGPFIGYACQSYKAVRGLPPRVRLRRAGLLLLSILIGLVIASFWYFSNLGGAYTMIKANVFDQKLQYQLLPRGIGFHRFGTKNLLHYPTQIFTHQLLPLFFVVAIASGAYLLLRKHRAVPFLSSWILIPYIVFTLVVVMYKKGRTVIPFLPSFIIFIGIACAMLPKKWRRRCALLLLTAGLFQFFVVTFFSGFPPVYNHDVGRTGPDTRDYHLSEITDTLNNLLQNSSDPFITIIWQFVYTADTLTYLQFMGTLLPCPIFDQGPCMSPNGCPERTYESYVRIIENSDVVLTLRDIFPPESSPAPEGDKNLFEAWNATASRFTLVNGWFLPDNWSLDIYAQAEPLPTNPDIKKYEGYTFPCTSFAAWRNNNPFSKDKGRDTRS